MKFSSNNSLPKHLIFNNRNISDQNTIGNSFYEYFVNVGPKLACEIPQLQRLFEMYLKESDSSFEEVSPGFDDINYNIVTENFNSLLVLLK